MRAMVLNALGPLADKPNAAPIGPCCRPGPGRGRDPDRGADLRRLPHRARRDRGADAAAAAADHPRPSGRRAGRGAGRRGRPLPAGRSRGRRLDLLGVRRVRLLPAGRGEPLRAVPGDRPRRQRRLRRADDRARGVRPRASPTPSPTRRPPPCCCAGAIGFRSLRLTGLEDGQSLGLTGFGASAHLVLKLVRHRFPDSRVFVFARIRGGTGLRPGAGRGLGRRHGRAGPREAACDHRHHPRLDADRRGAREPGAAAGGWSSTRSARRTATRTRCSDSTIPAHLWLEKEIKSVANVTRADVREFLRLAAEIPLKPEVQEYALEEANRALGRAEGEGGPRGQGLEDRLRDDSPDPESTPLTRGGCVVDVNSVGHPSLHLGPSRESPRQNRSVA